MNADFLECLSVFIDILLVIGGLGVFFTYRWQKKNEKRDAASLIILQIEELKEKLLKVNDMIVDGAINETSFYETVNILNDNQWEKYKHLFVNKIDNNSYKTINSFYEYITIIKEQLSLAKNLQQHQYFNIQGMLDTNCNAILIDIMSKCTLSIKDVIKDTKANTSEDEKIKSFILDNISLDESINLSKFFEKYNVKKEYIKEITNSSPYIPYIPKQIAITLNKQLNNVNSLEIIGCEGFKKLKKIAGIK